MSFGGSYTAALGNFGDLLYNGSLAYFAAWDTALSDSRILEHYTAGNGGTVFYGDDEVKRLGRILDYCNVPMTRAVSMIRLRRCKASKLPERTASLRRWKRRRTQPA
jgi:hypothetical protein